MENIKVMLGSSASNFTDVEIELAYRMALADVEDYCKREADVVMNMQAEKIAVIALLRRGTEGLQSTGAAGVNESYIDGWPDDVRRVLTRKRKMKVI